MEMRDLHKEVARLAARQKALDGAAAAAGLATAVSELDIVTEVEEPGGQKTGRGGGLGPESSAGPGRGRGRAPAEGGPPVSASPLMADSGRLSRQAAGGRVAPLDQHGASAWPLSQACEQGGPKAMAEPERAPGEAGADGCLRAGPGEPGPALPGLSRLEAQAWMLQMAAHEGCPVRLADEVGEIVAWMERAAVTGEDLCSMSAADFRDELPGVSLAVRKWLKKVASGHR